MAARHKATLWEERADAQRDNACEISFLGPLAWEHPVSRFAKGIDTSTSMKPDYALDMDVTQLAQSHHQLPQVVDRDCSKAPLLCYDSQASMLVRIIMYPQSAKGKPGSIRIDYPLMLSFQPWSSALAPTEIAQDGGSIPTERAPEVHISHDAPFNTPFHITRSPAPSLAVPSQPYYTPARERSSYDRPGKRPPAVYEPDPLKLEESCRRAGGSDFAVDWITSTFMHSVTTEALLRVLDRKEIDEMDFTGGFEPHQAYDGFISKVGGRYECGLCMEGKRTRWKNKKDAPRHLRKFHFGLADVCKDW